jgi:hypothetical protein
MGRSGGVSENALYKEALNAWPCCTSWRQTTSRREQSVVRRRGWHLSGKKLTDVCLCALIVRVTGEQHEVTAGELR